MKKTLLIMLLGTLLLGCHRFLDYSANPTNFNSPAEAIELLERIFHEDYGKQKVESVAVYPKYILLGDGIVSSSSGTAVAAPIGSGAIASGTTTTVTQHAGQRLYFSSLGKSTIHQRRLRSGRYVVIVRAHDGAELRKVSMRTLTDAERFVDAIEYLKQNAQ
ncbi:hypothetical protein HBN76_11490 [Pseudomonas sp. WS 5013]|uniref:hypothetical protein n=1 Tax=Pseudomonas sp. WS 5013 TaxID=2717475 RepID=UPI001475C824|nr:hypothetical protein [Pseudomonas sp. WS 5013]NMY41934.1 hypothetical protein [Pseudomonas sp. WS 5013]